MEKYLPKFMEKYLPVTARHFKRIIQFSMHHNKLHMHIPCT